MKHITRIHRMEPMIQKSNLLNIDRQHIFLHTLYSIEPGLYSSLYSPLLLWSLATYSRIKASSSRSRPSSKLLRMVCLYSEVVLDFRFGHFQTYISILKRICNPSALSTENSASRKLSVPSSRDLYTWESRTDILFLKGILKGLDGTLKINRSLG